MFSQENILLGQERNQSLSRNSAPSYARTKKVEIATHWVVPFKISRESVLHSNMLQLILKDDFMFNTSTATQPPTLVNLNFALLVGIKTSHVTSQHHSKWGEMQLRGLLSSTFCQYVVTAGLPMLNNPLFVQTHNMDNFSLLIYDSPGAVTSLSARMW